MLKRVKQEGEPYGVVYMWENLVNNKKYIGQTTDARKRKREHVGYKAKYKNGRPSLINRAISKYGVENFEFSILKECSSSEELDDWEIFYIKEYNSLADNKTGYNIMAGKIGKAEFPKSLKVNRSHNAQKNLKKSQGNFIGVQKKSTGFSVRVRLHGRKLHKFFQTEIEAAETYDCLVLHYHGESALINFPEKREEYLQKDLVLIYEDFISTRRKLLDYKWIVKGVKGRWQVRTTQMKNKPDSLFAGGFSSREEAAKMADKLMFVYENVPIEKLNFPELFKDLSKESVELSLMERPLILKPNLNSQKTIGTYKSGNSWATHINYKKRTYYLTSLSKNRNEAHIALRDYLKEILEKAPNLKNLLHLHLTQQGKTLLKNKDILDTEFVLKMKELYDYITSV